MIAVLRDKIANALEHFVVRKVRLDTSREMQILLSLQYRQMVAAKGKLPSFADAEFACYSQNGEDGILLLIFSAIGTTGETVVEICAGDGIECNAANLIVNHGWSGLLFDGSEANIQRGAAFYARRDTDCHRFRRLPPRLVHAWITAANIDGLITSAGFGGEIDLLSLDLDGVDFWIWKAIGCISPRVVVLEYNNRWPPELSVTVPYRDDFAAVDAQIDGAGYFGASLRAFAKLAADKGYRLVGANRPNTNAFFIRDDVGRELFPEVSVESCLSSPYALHQQSTKYPLIAKMEVVQV